ncbi:hypothetical protein QQP08_027567 [Theobroma cacao]|nr:hypothetical protein QQP08_027567 [Theobroma cacao]
MTLDLLHDHSCSSYFISGRIPLFGRLKVMVIRLQRNARKKIFPGTLRSQLQLNSSFNVEREWGDGRRNIGKGKANPMYEDSVFFLKDLLQEEQCFLVFHIECSSMYHTAAEVGCQWVLKMHSNFGFEADFNFLMATILKRYELKYNQAMIQRSEIVKMGDLGIARRSREGGGLSHMVWPSH